MLLGLITTETLIESVYLMTAVRHVLLITLYLTDYRQLVALNGVKRNLGYLRNSFKHNPHISCWHLYIIYFKTQQG